MSRHLPDSPTAAEAAATASDAKLHALPPGKRKQILDGARRVFMGDGFDAASMDSVAREAGVSKGTLYNHFDSKQALFAALIQMQCEMIRSRAFAMDDVAGDPAEVLHRVGITFAHSVLQPASMDMFRTILSQAHRFPDLGEVFDESGPRPALAALGGYLRGLCDAGVLAIDDEALAARQFVELCLAGMGIRAHLQLGRPDDAEIERTVAAGVRLFLAGYKRGA